MADIDVVPKKRTNTWLWIIVAIVIALIAWAIIAAMNNTPDRVGRADVGTPAVFSGTAAMEALVS